MAAESNADPVVRLTRIRKVWYRHLRAPHPQPPRGTALYERSGDVIALQEPLAALRDHFGARRSMRSRPPRSKAASAHGRCAGASDDHASAVASASRRHRLAGLQHARLDLQPLPDARRRT